MALKANTYYFACNVYKSIERVIRSPYLIWDQWTSNATNLCVYLIKRFPFSVCSTAHITAFDFGVCQFRHWFKATNCQHTNDSLKMAIVNIFRANDFISCIENWFVRSIVTMFGMTRCRGNAPSPSVWRVDTSHRNANQSFNFLYYLFVYTFGGLHKNERKSTGKQIFINKSNIDGEVSNRRLLQMQFI